MPRTAVSIAMPDGVCQASLHVSADSGSWPGVLVFPDAAGKRETFAVMADRLAGLGYAVLLPDVYYRVPWEPFQVDTVFSDPAERARLLELARGLTPELAVPDTGAYLDFLLGRPEVSGSAVGTTGYCMGGKLSLLAAGHYPGQVAASASFHGGWLAAEDDPESPHLLASRMCAELYVAAAENDDAFPPEQYQRLADALSAAGVPHVLETYPAAHGFAVPDNPTYDEAAEQRHWAALADLYGRRLPGSAA